ncbi:TniQ family protein [Streptomyces sp. NPDC088341]|uniref:TniQ family protein n=1 Tax=Streptomyces sp. NPDC088341 TaxID=3154870 RepID=UPI00341CD8B8
MRPSVPGPLRVRPLPGEPTASYLTRLTAAYRLSPAQLLDGLCITVTGTENAPPAAEIRLNAEAARRLSGLTRIPLTHPTRARPTRARPRPRRPTPVRTARPPPAGTLSSPPCSHCRRVPPAPSAAARTRQPPRGSTRRRACPGS